MNSPTRDLTTFFSFVLTIPALLMTHSASAQRPGTHYDEARIPPYTLPNLLLCEDGQVIGTPRDWDQKRRSEIIQLFSDHVYGRVPDKNVSVSFETKKSWDALDGTAFRKEIAIRIGEPGNQVDATLLLTVPKSEIAAPCFLGLNFHGNHTTTHDANVTVTDSWVRNNKSSHAANHQASAEGRGSSSSRWPYEEIIKAGYGVATLYYGDIDPDHDDQFQNGIHPLFYAVDQTRPDKNQWGSIGAWAWSLSRSLDYLETEPLVDAKRVAVFGHSRLGKTALWAGATDSRFRMVISNNSGCGGAALFRRGYGETVKVINTSFPHWFCDQFAEYNRRENDLPIDQHMLIALIAPRAVYVASATEDKWADPNGEFLSLANADPVFRLFGNQSLNQVRPDPDSPLWSGSRAYHLRTGKHNITLYDWQQYLRFADQQFKFKMK